MLSKPIETDAVVIEQNIPKKNRVFGAAKKDQRINHV